MRFFMKSKNNDRKKSSSNNVKLTVDEIINQYELSLVERLNKFADKARKDNLVQQTQSDKVFLAQGIGSNGITVGLGIIRAEDALEDREKHEQASESTLKDDATVALGGASALIASGGMIYSLTKLLTKLNIKDNDVLVNFVNISGNNQHKEGIAKIAKDVITKCAPLITALDNGGHYKRNKDNLIRYLACIILKVLSVSSRFNTKDCLEAIESLYLKGDFKPFEKAGFLVFEDQSKHTCLETILKAKIFATAPNIQLSSSVSIVPFSNAQVDSNIQSCISSTTISNVQQQSIDIISSQASTWKDSFEESKKLYTAGKKAFYAHDYKDAISFFIDSKEKLKSIAQNENIDNEAKEIVQKRLVKLKSPDGKFSPEQLSQKLKL